MPTVKLNKEVFEKLVGKKLNSEELKDRISMLGTDLEGIEGNIINVEVFPNRPDMLSEQGFARAFSSFIGVKTGLRHYKVNPSKDKVIIDSSVSEVRPYTACALVKNIKFTDEKIIEVIQMQEKLHVTYGRNRKKVAIGVYPAEKIKFPISFVGKKPNDIKFQPLETKSEMTAKEILEKHSTGKEYGHLLEGYKKYPLFLDANNKILSMPPIVNSHNIGKVNEKTTDVFIECSGFDFEVLKKCLNIIVTALADMGGDIYSLNLEYKDKTIVSPDLNPTSKKIDLDYINKRLGLELTKKEMFSYLEKMGFGNKGDNVLIPAYRADILHMVDFVEDVAIAYGYENFDAVIPNCATIGREDPFEVFKNKVANILVGLSFLELNTNNIANEEFQTIKMNTKVELVKLKNALSTDYNVMRSWVLPSVMEVLSTNTHNEYPQNLFNIGRVFKKDNSTKTGILENDRIAVALCNEDADYTHIKQVLDYLCANIGVVYEIEEAEHGSFIEGRCARITINKKKVAYIGEINPKVLENWDVQMPVSAFELNLSELFNSIKE